jgi:uncharacterized membrane protein
VGEEYAVPPGDDMTENDKLMAAISYPIPLVAIVILLVEEMKERPFQRYHAVQALAANVVLWLVIVLVGCILGTLSAIVGGVCGMAVFLLWFITLYWAYEAYQGKYFEIPALTQFLKDQNWL